MAIAELNLITNVVQEAAQPLEGKASDYDQLLKLINRQISIALRGPRLERAIGVIYLPQTEQQSHYFDARLSDQFDAVIHFDETRALEPLERYALWETSETPETFPYWSLERSTNADT